MPFNQKLLPNKTRFNWRLVRRHKQAVSLCTRVMYFSTAALAFSGIALAEPTGGVVTGGSGTISQSGATTDINQSSHQLNIDWQTFNVGASETVNFHQPGATSIAINRVLKGPSEIRGAINANGRLVFLNQSGITFFEGARVNVGSLMASTAASASMQNGVLSFSGGGYAQIINHGDITVTNGGFAILAAPHVVNTGTITADEGQIELAATGGSYTLDLTGDGLITFSVDANSMTNMAADGEALGIDNTGTLRARSGAVKFTSTVLGSMVNLGGVVDADAFTTDGHGGSVLVASAGDLNLTGAISADGGANGDGGSVETWADGTNYFNADATINARGGAESGDGGFIEVSGKNVRYLGSSDASAANGKGGTVLLDPVHIIISDNDGISDEEALGTQTISEGKVEDELTKDQTFILSADHTITIDDLSDDKLTSTKGSLRLVTGDEDAGTGNITMNTGDTLESTGGGSITILAEGSEANIVLGNIDVNNSGDTDNNAGEVSITSRDGSISVVNTTIESNIAIGAEETTATASLDMTAADDIEIFGNTNVEATIEREDSALSITADASADLEAGTDGSGSILIGDETAVGEFRVAASAVKTPGLGGDSDPVVGGDAEAIALAEMDAADDITVNTGATTLAVDADAANIGAGGGNATADADLNLDADTGNIAISGATEVTADAQLAPGAVPGEAVTTENDLTVTSFATRFTGQVLGNAIADADAILLADEGNVSADAITVAAAANIDVGAINASNIVLGDESNLTAFGGPITGNAEADATLDIDASGNVNVHGVVSVTADAHINIDSITMTGISVTSDSFGASFTGFAGSSIVGGVGATAELDVDAGGAVNFSAEPVTDGDVTTAGITVAAAAGQSVGAIDMSATVMSTGNTASFVGSNNTFTDATYSDAKMRINSDESSVNLKGGADVSSLASQTVESVDISGTVTASTGSSSVASATFDGFNDEILGAESLTSAASIEVTAQGNIAVGDEAGADLIADADGILSVGPVVIDATVSATAGSNGGNAIADFDAVASENILDLENLRINNDEGLFPGIRLNSSNGDVRVDGDVLATADGLAEVKSLTMTGSVEAINDGDGSATASYNGIDRDAIFVETVTSEAQVEVNANGREGDIDIGGDVGAAASSVVSMGDVKIDVTVSATQNDHDGFINSGSTNASFQGTGESIVGNDDNYEVAIVSYAEIDLNANGEIDVDGNVQGSSDARVIVGNVDIDGSATALDQAGYGGSVNASFSAIGDDVVQIGDSNYDGFIRARTNVFVDVDGYGGISLGTETGDMVSATSQAGVSVGNVEIDGFARATDETPDSAYVRADFDGVEGNVANVSVDYDGFEHAILSGANVQIHTEGPGSHQPVSIAGGVEATSDATVDVGNITINGIADANTDGQGQANAYFTGVDDDVVDVSNDEDGYDGFKAYSQINISGDGVFIGGSVNSEAEAGATVGIVDIDGSAKMTADGYGGFGSNEARFQGLGDDVIDIEAYGGGINASSVVSIDGRNDSVEIGGSATSMATAMASVGNIDITGSATASNGGTYYATADYEGIDGGVVEIDIEAYGGSVDAKGLKSYSSVNLYGSDVDVGGNVTSDAASMVTVGTINIDGSASATVRADAGYGYADGDFTGIEQDVVDVDAYGDALKSRGEIEIIASGGYGGGVDIGGNVNSSANATVAVGTVRIVGSANATYNENEHGSAYATFEGIGDQVVDVESEDYDAFNASAATVIVSNNSYVEIGGDVKAVANSGATVGALTINGSAIASGAETDGYGGGYASAFFTGIEDAVVDIYADEDSIVARSDLDIHSGGFGEGQGAVTVGGKVESLANAGVAVGDMTATINAQGNDGAISAYADATGFGEGAFFRGGFGEGDLVNVGLVQAIAEANVTGEGTVTLTGGLETTANAVVSVGNMQGNSTHTGEYTESIGFVRADFRTDAYARAVTHVESYREDVIILDDISSNANANVSIGDFSDAGAFAEGSSFDANPMLIGGQTPIRTDFFIQENIAFGGAFSEGFLSIRAGQEGNGAIQILGNATVTATANFSAGTNVETARGNFQQNNGFGEGAGAFAMTFGEIDASNDVTIDGTEIGSEATATTDAEGALALSTMLIQAGEREQGADPENTYQEGNVAIRGDIYSRATAITEDGQASFSEGLALLDISAHGEQFESDGEIFGGGTVVNEYFTHAPQAVVTQNSGSAFTDATQTEVDAAQAADTDGSPTTFIEGAKIGEISNDLNNRFSLESGETELPTDIELSSEEKEAIGFFFPLIGFGLADGASATTVVHFHEEAVIFGPDTGAPPALEGIDPFILTLHPDRVTPVSDSRFPTVSNFGPDDTTAPGQSPTSLSLTPGSTACTMGEDGISINSDGQLLFAEFMFQETSLEFGENGCDEVVAFPQVDVQ